MKVLPLSDRVLVKPDEADEKTPGGIILPDVAKDKPLKGRVVAVGAGRLLDSGDRVPFTVKVGDHVLWGRYDGVEIEIERAPHRILFERELVGILQ